MNLRNAYVEAGHWAEAEAVLERALAIDPESMLARRNLERAQRRSPHE